MSDDWRMGMIRKQKFLSLSAAAICNIIWGFSFLASRAALNSAPVYVLLSHRFLLAFAIMLLLCLTGTARCDLRGKPLGKVLLLGILEPVIYFIGEQNGLLHSNTIFSGVMISLIPVAATLAAVPVLGERPPLRQLAFSILSVSGVIGMGLLSKSSGSLDWIGVLCLLIAVFSAVGYTLLSRTIAAQYTAFERTLVMMGISALVFTVMALVTVHGDMAEYCRPLSVGSYRLPLLYLGICCSIVSFFLSGYALTTLPVAMMTVFSNLTTAVSVFAGAVILHEPFSPLGLLFCALILLGIYGVQRSGNKKEEQT